MTEDKKGWLFGYGVYKIHYFINGVALCGKVEFGKQTSRGQNISKPINLKLDDKRACKRCIMMLQTYDNLDNRLNKKIKDIVS